MTHVRSANKPRKRYAPLLRIVSLLKRLICKYVVSTLSDIQAQEIQNLWRTTPLNHAASSVNQIWRKWISKRKSETPNVAKQNNFPKIFY